jgi:hypothetical protein
MKCEKKDFLGENDPLKQSLMVINWWELKSPSNLDEGFSAFILHP